MPNQNQPIHVGYMGHNPRKLGGLYSYSAEPWQRLRHQMYQETAEKLNQGQTVVCEANLSQGVDLLWALVATDLKAHYPAQVAVNVYGAAPTMADKWSGDMQAVFDHVTRNPNVNVQFANDRYTSDNVSVTKQHVASACCLG